MNYEYNSVFCSTLQISEIRLRIKIALVQTFMFKFWVLFPVSSIPSSSSTKYSQELLAEPVGSGKFIGFIKREFFISG